MLIHLLFSERHSSQQSSLGFTFDMVDLLWGVTHTGHVGSFGSSTADVPHRSSGSWDVPFRGENVITLLFSGALMHVDSWEIEQWRILMCCFASYIKNNGWGCFDAHQTLLVPVALHCMLAYRDVSNNLANQFLDCWNCCVIFFQTPLCPTT